jgi:hypothetical protein
VNAESYNKEINDSLQPSHVASLGGNCDSLSIGLNFLHDSVMLHNGSVSDRAGELL